MSFASEPITTLIEEKETYTLYKYRFFIIVVYIVATQLNVMMFTLFGSLQSTLVNVYNEDLTYINFGTVLIGSISFIPACFIGNYIMDTFGLKFGFLVGTVLNLIGLWLRCLSKHSFGWIFAGQCFAGIAQPYFSTITQKISSIWFGPSERAIATTVMICGNLVGNSVWFVDINADNQTILDQLQKMFLYMAIFSSVVYIFTSIFMREKPPTPPSKAAAAAKPDYVKSIKSLIQDKNAMVMLVGTGIVCGTLTNYGSTIQQVLQPLGINAYQVSDIVAIAVFVSPVGSLIGAGVIAKFKKYNLMIIGASAISLAFLVLNMFAAENGNIYFYGVTVMIYVITVSPINPVALEYGMELAFPVGESTLGGIWSVINSLSSTIESLIVDAVLGKTPTRGDARTTFIIIAGYQAVATILLFFVKERLKRKEFESQDQDQENQAKIDEINT